MALNSTGPLSIGGSTAGQSINLEFGRTATQQTALSQLYRGGGIVPNATPNNAIPTSGAIAIGNFYGATNRVAIAITIASNVQNYNLYTQRGGSYAAGISDLTYTINSGVIVGSSSNGSFAMATGTFASGDTVKIVNNGYIVGTGGNGGAPNSGTGGSGGPALQASFAISMTNNGTVGGGGGGGGGGGYYYSSQAYGSFFAAGGGGGGGAGNSVGAAGGSSSGQWGTSGAGSAGTTTTGGGGGGGTPNAGSGGSGGNLGSGGGSGGSGLSTGGGSGGGAGAATSGNSYITWLVTGTRNGALN